MLLLALCGRAAAQALPLLAQAEPAASQSPESATPAEPAAPSACRLRLTADLASAPSVAAIEGPGACGAEDAVRLEAVLLPDRRRVAVAPPAVMRCELAEAIVHWVREDLAPAARLLKSAVKSIDNYAAYDCRGRNRIAGAILSEHGKANALDIRSVRLANGELVGLTFACACRSARAGGSPRCSAPVPMGITKITSMWTWRGAATAIGCAIGRCASRPPKTRAVRARCHYRGHVPDA